MNYRKIIEFGKSSCVVSLPKSWLVEKKLKKGDIVYFDCQGDKLVIYPAEPKTSQGIKKTSIDVTNMSEKEIRIQLISKYIMNFNEVALVADDIQPKAKDIRNIIHDLMALEVMEENSTRIVAKCFINMEEVCPKDIVNKMDMITREMLRDSNSFVSKNHANISERDSDVNRLAYLCMRFVRFSQKNPSVIIKRGITHDQAMALWAASLKIEKVADQAKRIAKHLKMISFDKRDQEEFKKLYASVINYYEEAMSAFYSEDSEKAFKIMFKKSNLIKKCRDFYRENWDHEWVPLVLEKLKTIVAESEALLTYICDMEK